jgi:hypothetical protein
VTKAALPAWLGGERDSAGEERPEGRSHDAPTRNAGLRLLGTTATVGVKLEIPSATDTSPSLGRSQEPRFP